MPSFSSLIAYFIIGLFTGAAYSIAASGLVLTYTTTRVFNIAHGAFGMLFAFLYWQLTVDKGYPVWISLIAILLVIAPATGFFIERFVTRGLGNGPVSVSLVVTVGLLVICFGIAFQAYPNDEPRAPVPYFLPDVKFNLGSTVVNGYQILTIFLSVVVALGLYLLLNKTRIGTAMRASVDNPDLLRLFGGKPDLAAGMAWAIGISLAALTGILLVSTIGLDYYQLTLLVINAYAAAMLGRLKSLPLTFVGAMVLGILTSYATGYLPSASDNPIISFLAQARPVIPSIFLFILIIALPQSQLRIGQVKGIVSAPLPSPVQALGWAGGLFVMVLLLSNSMDAANQLRLGNAVYIAIVMLSLVLLTGYGGHVSLGQLAFAGIGALSYAKFGQFNITGLVFAALVTAGVGALVALAVLRLTGLYLTLATLAFATLAEKLIFTSSIGFGFGGTKTVEPLNFFGITFPADRPGKLVVLMAVFLIAIALGLLVLRRGVVGRMLIALRDSPAACGTLGLDQRWFRVVLFAVSAGIAGLAGALFSGLRGSVGTADFMAFSSLPLLLFAVVFGVTSMTGAVMGGTAYMLYSFSDTNTQGIILIVLGVGELTLGRNPNGISNLIFQLGRFVQRQVGPRVRGSLPALPGLSRPVPAGDGVPTAADADGTAPDVVTSGHDHAHGHDHTHDPVPAGAPGTTGATVMSTEKER